jgi:electron transfer flavoprotein beta subunit
VNDEPAVVNVLVCVKRVPVTGGRIVLTADEQAIDTRFLGFTVSPHEECAAEEAVRLVEAHGGTSAVLTLGPPEAADQLRDAMAIGVDRGIHLRTLGGQEWDGLATAAAVVDAVRAQEDSADPFDLILFGNESADAGGYQVGVRVAHALGRPVVTGVKQLEVSGGRAVARREAGGGWEVFEVPLPAVLTVKEGINLPRYPSMPGRLKAKKKPLEVIEPAARPGDLRMARLRLPGGTDKRVQILGEGTDAVPAAVDVLRRLGVVG